MGARGAVPAFLVAEISHASNIDFLLPHSAEPAGMHTAHGGPHEPQALGLQATLLTLRSELAPSSLRARSCASPRSPLDLAPTSVQATYQGAMYNPFLAAGRAVLSSCLVEAVLCSLLRQPRRKCTSAPPGLLTRPPTTAPMASGSSRPAPNLR